MADFKPAYEIIKRWEGGYANVPTDKGGETYAGIARRFWPNWSGWEIVDNKPHPIRNNTKFPELDYAVENFYHQLWTAGRFDQIASQEVANIAFDFRVNSGTTAIKKIQQIVGASADGVFGVDSMRRINAANPAKLNNDIKIVREKFYNQLALKPGQDIFLQGWLNRLSSFPTIPVVSGLAVLVIGLTLLILANK